MLSKFLIFIFLLSISTATRIQITNGIIEGRELTSTYSLYGNQTSTMFLGIPHCEPPIGELRFRRPLEYKKKWNGVLETKQLKPACMSNVTETFHDPNGGIVSEDCLYLNVYTNQFCLENKNCSVMVAIHGGQMIRGSTALFHNDVVTNNFVGQDRNIVVVTVPYRLGVFGLPNLPGDLDGIVDNNLVLYDVIEAFKWVNREIGNFGGNSSRITFFGHSGGGSVGAILSLIPEFDNLYQKTVLMSAPWLMQSKLSNSKIFIKVAQKVGCYESPKDNKVILECMRKVPAEKIMEAQEHVFLFEEQSISDFAIDGKLLKENPRRLLESGNFTKKPLLIGTVPNEIRYTQYFMKNDGKIDENELLKLCELIGFAGSYEKPYGFVEKCVEFYMKNNTYQYMIDDYVFQMPTANFAYQNSLEKPVYLYSYTYSGLGQGFTNYIENYTSPIHSEDFAYIFGVHRSSNFTKKDLQIEKIFTGMIADFVNFGEPKGNDWTKLNPEIMNFFDIDFDKELEMTGIRYEFLKKNRQFWNEISKEFGGEFSFSEDSSESFDVFPLREYTEMKNIHLKTPHWDADKSVDVAERILKEIEKYITEKKKKFDDETSFSASLLTFSCILLLTIFMIL